MSANTMKPRKITSSFSKREKLRRNPHQAPEQALDFVAPLAQLPVVFPRVTPSLARRHHRIALPGQRKLAWLVAFLCPVHRHRPLLSLASQAPEQFTTPGRSMGLSRGQRDRHRCARSRGNPMHLGGPSPAGLAAGRWPGLFRAPVPAGCTFRMYRPAIHPGVEGMPLPEPGWTWTPRYLLLRSAPYRRALSTGRFETCTFPRCAGSNGAMRSSCASVSSIRAGSHRSTTL